MKTTAEIKKLIALFYQGEASAEQEKELIEYFSQTDISEDLKEEQVILNAMFKKDLIEVPTALENRLIAQIDHLENCSKPSVFTLQKKWVWTALAASFALLIGISFLLTMNTSSQSSKNLSQTDIEKIQKAQEAIILVSKKYNKGLDQLSYSQKTIEYSSQIFKKSINNLNP